MKLSPRAANSGARGRFGTGSALMRMSPGSAQRFAFNSPPSSQDYAVTSPTEPLTRRLKISTPLGPDDIEAIARLQVIVKDLPPQAAIVREGERPSQCCLLIEGFACRSKTTDIGKRQILSIHIAGDIPDLQSLHLHV